MPYFICCYLDCTNTQDMPFLSQDMITAPWYCPEHQGKDQLTRREEAEVTDKDVFRRTMSDDAGADIMPSSDDSPSAHSVCEPFQSLYSRDLGVRPTDQELGSRTLPEDAGTDFVLKGNNDSNIFSTKGERLSIQQEANIDQLAHGTFVMRRSRGYEDDGFQ